MRWIVCALAAVISSAGMVGPAIADDLILWHSENLQLQLGRGFELGDDGRAIITFEHANQWRAGDVFLFTDFTVGEDGGHSVYGEVMPRLSLSRLTGVEWRAGPVSDVLIAGVYEFGDEGLNRSLIGAAIDLEAPGFTFLRLHGFHRDDPTRAGTTWQATISWNRPITLGENDFVFEGFADFAGAEGRWSETELITSRFLWRPPENAGALHHLYIGLEHQYWHNKFGVRGVDESVAQFQIKWMLN